MITVTAAVIQLTCILVRVIGANMCGEDCEQASRCLQGGLTNTFAGIIVTMRHGRGVARNSIPMKMRLHTGKAVTDDLGSSQSGIVQEAWCTLFQDAKVTVISPQLWDRL